LFVMSGCGTKQNLMNHTQARIELCYLNS